MPVLSNRLWLAKVGIGLLVFLGLCADAAWRLPKRYPRVKTVVAEAEKWDGKQIFVEPLKVREAGDGFVVVHDEDKQLRILTKEPFKKDAYVTAVGTFHRDGPAAFVLTPSRIRAADHWELQRGAIYGVSAAVLLGWLWFFLKTFSFTFKGLAPKSVAVEVK